MFTNVYQCYCILSLLCSGLQQIICQICSNLRQCTLTCVHTCDHRVTFDLWQVYICKNPCYTYDEFILKRVIYRYSYSTLCYITIIEHHFKLAFSAVKLHHFFLVLNNFRKKCSRKGLKLFAIGVFLANWIHIFT